MNELALFAGAGGGILGGKLLGWRTVCAVEWEPYPASVLCARQNDGVLAPFPIWDDVRTFDGRPWRGIVDVVSGGFPCQDISCAGKGAGINGEQSGMWKEMARIVGEVRPRYVFVENSPMLTSRGLGVVLGDLAEMGYNARWGVLGAVHAGAPHKRERIWIVADSDDKRFMECCGSSRESRTFEEWAKVFSQQEIEHKGHNFKSSCLDRSISSRSTENMADSECEQDDAERRLGERGRDAVGQGKKATLGQDGEAGANGSRGRDWWATEPDVGGTSHGLA